MPYYKSAGNVMRNWERHEEAKRLRDSGLTYKEIGAALGVSTVRAKQMLDELLRHHAQLAREAENPGLKKWGSHLNPSTRSKMESWARELQSHGWKVEPPGEWHLK